VLTVRDAGTGLGVGLGALSGNGLADRTGGKGADLETTNTNSQRNTRNGHFVFDQSRIISFIVF